MPLFSIILSILVIIRGTPNQLFHVMVDILNCFFIALPTVVAEGM